MCKRDLHFCRSCFLSIAPGPKAELYTNPCALRVLLETFGGHIVICLVQTMESSLKQAVMVLDSLLMAHAALLKPIYIQSKANTLI